MNRNRLCGLIYNLKKFLRFEHVPRITDFAFVSTYSDAGYVFLDFAVVTLGLLP